MASENVRAVERALRRVLAYYGVKDRVEEIVVAFHGLADQYIREPEDEAYCICARTDKPRD